MGKDDVSILFDDIMFKYDEMDVRSIIDERIASEYSDFDPEEFGDEFDSYYETGSNQIETEVLEEIIRVRSEELDIELDDDDTTDLIENLADEWGISIL